MERSCESVVVLSSFLWILNAAFQTQLTSSQTLPTLNVMILISDWNVTLIRSTQCWGHTEIYCQIRSWRKTLKTSLKSCKVDFLGRKSMVITPRFVMITPCPRVVYYCYDYAIIIITILTFVLFSYSIVLNLNTHYLSVKSYPKSNRTERRRYYHSLNVQLKLKTFLVSGSQWTKI